MANGHQLRMPKVILAPLPRRCASLSVANVTGSVARSRRPTVWPLRMSSSILLGAHEEKAGYELLSATPLRQGSPLEMSLVMRTSGDGLRRLVIKLLSPYSKNHKLVKLSRAISPGFSARKTRRSTWKIGLVTVLWQTKPWQGLIAWLKLPRRLSVKLNVMVGHLRGLPPTRTSKQPRTQLSQRYAVRASNHPPTPIGIDVATLSKTERYATRVLTGPQAALAQPLSCGSRWNSGHEPAAFTRAPSEPSTSK